MQSTSERRQEMRWLLSDRRFVTIQQLMDRFQISRSTVIRDLNVLCETTPIMSVQGNGGGIRVADGWYAGRRYLNAQQEALLKALRAGLQPEQKEIMQSILDSFGTPKTFRKE